MRVHLTNAVTFWGPQLQVGPVDILIRDGAIDEISDEPLHPDEGMETYDLGGNLVLPGFIDAYTHLNQSFASGFYDGLTPDVWLEALAHNYRLTEDEYYDATLLACMEAIKAGTTCVCSLTGLEGIDAALQAIIDSGLRSSVGLVMRDETEGTLPPPRMSAAKYLKASEAFHKHWDGTGWGRAKVVMALSGLPYCSEGLLRGTRALAEQLKTNISIPCSRDPAGSEVTRQRYNCSEVEMLQRCGVLGPDCSLAHCVWLDEDDIQSIANHDSHVIYCPSANMKLAAGIPPITRLINRGINVALGSDGAASGGTFDLLKEVRAGALLQKVATMNPTVMEPEQGLAMLTRAGAEATGWSGKIGVLSPGYRADLTVIRYPQPHLVGENRLLSNLIYSSAGGDVQAVFVDGSALLWNRSLVHMDEEQIIRRVENRLRRKNFSPESYPSKGKPPAALPGEWEYISRHR